MIESRFDCMMLESQWRDEQRDRMAGQQVELPDGLASALKICPSQYIAELHRTYPTPSTFATAIRNTVLIQACLRALAVAPDNIKLAALGVLEETTPHDPDSSLLNCVLGTLMGFSLDLALPAALRYRAANVIDELCRDLKQENSPTLRAG